MNIIKKTVEIVEGVRNWVYSGDEMEEFSKARMAVCNTCEHKTSINTCGICGCLLLFKTRSPKSECPKKKWEDVDKPLFEKKEKSVKGENTK